MKKIHILIFILIGAVLGGGLGIISYNKLFAQYLDTTRDYVNEDWNRMEYFTNQMVDHVIKLHKMKVKDKVKFNVDEINDVVGVRARLLGADTLDEKATILFELEDEINDILAEYNHDMKLRASRFFYLEWGNDMEKNINLYKEHRDYYRNLVNQYNFRVKAFPFTLFAKNQGHFVLPLITESKLVAVQVATEKYSKDDLLSYFSEESPDSSEHGAH